MARRITLDQLEVAKQCLEGGGIIAFPTDTVYGLACRCDSQELQERLKHVKGRPEEKPFPIVVGSFEQCQTLAVVDERTLKIMESCWPGPLTLILNRRDDVEEWVTNGQKTIALRMFDEEGITQMIQQCSFPLFLTSANLSDEPVCQNGDEVFARLGDRIDLIVEGKHRTGLASTILDCTQAELKVVREGPISLEVIYHKMKEETQ